jgi:outer membrane lipoprotein carrier protein
MEGSASDVEGGRGPRYTALGLLALLTLATSLWAAAPDAPAQDLAAALQRKYETLRDFSADFEHTYRGGVLRKQLVERGHVLVKKPGRMRWQYAAPDEKLFVSDGVKLYSYIPQDKQVYVGTVPSDDRATTPVLFLAGKGNLLRDFTTSLVQPLLGMPPGTRALKLMPISPQRDYDWLIIEVAPDLQLRGLVTLDAQGGESSFSFTHLKENVGLTDKDFVFKMPRGVDVVTESPSR